MRPINEITRIIFPLGLTLLITFTLFGQHAWAFNPHHRLTIAEQTEVALTPVGAKLLERLGDVRSNEPILFYCLNLSCDEDFIAFQNSSLKAVNGQYFSASNAHLGKLVYEALVRSKLANESYFSSLELEHRELLVAKRVGEYLISRENTLGRFSSEDDYANHPRFNYARDRHRSLIEHRNAFLSGEAALRELVRQRLLKGSPVLYSEKSINF